MPFSFWLRTDARFGIGVSRMLPEFVETRGCKRVAVIVDKGVRENAHLQPLLHDLEQVVEVLQVEESDAVEPTYDYLDEFRTRFDSDLDLMIGIGGGSILDLTKAISVLVTNSKPAISYRGFDLIEKPGIPVVAIPTTAGTGSEVTPNAVFTDAKEQRKFGINTAMYVPILALLDPQFTVSCPKSVTVSSGMDALVHSVESFVAKGATPVSRMLSREAFRLVMAHLPLVVEQPDNLDARLAMQLGAFYAGSALMNGGGGITGALSYPLGVLFKVPHGIAGGIFLATVSRFNVDRGATVYSGFYDLLDDASEAANEKEQALAVCNALDALAARVDVPRSLETYGVKASDLDDLAEQTFLLSGAIEQNPVEVSGQDIRNILAARM